jgi:ABC-type glycerol-3-phosphate transport system permease component
MADFTKKIGTLESDRRSSLRHYIMIVYIAGIMVVLVTAVMLSLLSSSAIIGLQGTHTKIDPATVDYLLASSIFEGWVMGFVAGKMGESSIAEGFKHSVIMVVISLVSILIARSFIAFPV